ncbi:MAG: SdrD B-like domain-containing protein [Caldilineaceae bacterium]
MLTQVSHLTKASSHFIVEAGKIIFVTFILLFVSLLPFPVHAQAQQPDPAVCYAIADNEGVRLDGNIADGNDQFVKLNRFTAETTPIGPTGTTNIEAMTFVLKDGVNLLYAADGGNIGTVNLNSGVFTRLGFAGTGTGSIGSVDFNDLDSLAYDITTNIIYASHRFDHDNDLLLKIDPATGAHIPNAFGPGKDYLVVPTPAGRPFFKDVDDLGIDPTTGELYATINDGGTEGILAKLDKNTAAVTEIAIYKDTKDPNNIVDDIEGMSFFNDGTLYGSTGNNGPDAHDSNKLWRIDKQTGMATLIGSFPANFIDYEAVGCLTANASIALKKYTNGMDADAPPGPQIQIGKPVIWSYVIENTGGVTLNHIVLTDDQLGTIACLEGPIPDLAPQQKFICTVQGTATTVGQYTNIGTVRGNWVAPSGVQFEVSATDPSHYFGIETAELAGSLGDTVWNDTNGNGVQERGERGFAGIQVTLFDGNGRVLKTTTTNDQGRYQFTELAGGDYKVGFALPDGYYFSPANNVSDDTIDSDVVANNQTALIHLAPGQNDPTQDAGVFAPPNLTIRKFADRTKAAEPGQSIVYTYVYTNSGLSDATNVVLIETVPQYTIFDVQNSTPGWDCTGGAVTAGTICVFNVGVVPAKTTVTSQVKFVVRIDPSIPTAIKQVSNTVGIEDDGTHGSVPGGTANTSTVITNVIRPTDLGQGGEPTAPTTAIFLPLIQQNSR